MTINSLRRTLCALLTLFALPAALLAQTNAPISPAVLERLKTLYPATRFAEVRPGTYDINERVRDMNANGVLGSMCFPSFPQFCGQTFMKNPEHQVREDLRRFKQMMETGEIATS